MVSKIHRERILETRGNPISIAMNEMCAVHWFQSVSEHHAEERARVGADARPHPQAVRDGRGEGGGGGWVLSHLCRQL